MLDGKPLLPRRSRIMLGHIYYPPASRDRILKVLRLSGKYTGIRDLLNMILLPINDFSSPCIPEDNNFLCSERHYEHWNIVLQDFGGHKLTVVVIWVLGTKGFASSAKTYIDITQVLNSAVANQTLLCLSLDQCCQHVICLSWGIPLFHIFSPHLAAGLWTYCFRTPQL